VELDNKDLRQTPKIKVATENVPKWRETCNYYELEIIVYDSLTSVTKSLLTDESNSNIVNHTMKATLSNFHIA
jgi:hypothetical protein